MIHWRENCPQQRADGTWQKVFDETNRRTIWIFIHNSDLPLHRVNIPLAVKRSMRSTPPTNDKAYSNSGRFSDFSFLPEETLVELVNDMLGEDDAIDNSQLP